MFKNLYSIYDKKSQTYAQPMAEINDGTAQRIIMDLMHQNPQHPFNRYPDDYELVRIGRFNELDGNIDLGGDEIMTVVAQLATIRQAVAGE